MISCLLILMVWSLNFVTMNWGIGCTEMGIYILLWAGTTGYDNEIEIVEVNPFAPESCDYFFCWNSEIITSTSFVEKDIMQEQNPTHLTKGGWRATQSGHCLVSNELTMLYFH